jgi:hypothetical protein
MCQDLERGFMFVGPSELEMIHKYASIVKENVKDRTKFP